MGKKRLDYVDIAKGIAIIAVVLMHINYPFPSSSIAPIRALLGYGWHVATFFIIGGFFLKEEKLLNPFSFINGKIRSLYLLSLYFYIPAVLLHNFFIDIGWYDTAVLYGGKHITSYTLPQIAKNILETFFCAGREPILGAMWFVNVLFMAFCLMSVIASVIHRIFKGKGDAMQYVYPIVLFVLSCGANISTNCIGFNIPRCNNVFTAMWLIYIGYWVKNKAKSRFDNNWICVTCALTFIYFCIIQPIGVDLNGNRYADLITLTIGSLSAVYVICYLSQKIQSTYVGSILKRCGKDSFYIMALHFIGFKIGIYMLNAFGYGISLCSLTPQTQGEWLLIPYYVFWGIIIPLIFMYLFRKIKFFLTTYHR